MAKEYWQNNEIGKILSEKYKHDFSVCDVDGICRHNVKVGRDIFKRLIIYESKNPNEAASQTQLETLYDIQENMKWENFDASSGVYLLKHYGDTENITICKIVLNHHYVKLYYEVIEILDSTISEFYNWITHRENEISEHFEHKTFTYKSKKIEK